MTTLRCFIAIEISPEVGQALTELRSTLASRLPAKAVRWVAPENIHLTLKFLGDTEDASIEPIGNALQSVAASIEPFRLRLDQLGCFPNPRKPRVIWVGVGGDLGALLQLQQEIESGLLSLGWRADGRKFHPHLTLGRVKDSRQVVEARLAWGEVLAQGGQPVAEVCLIQSDIRPSGAVYSTRRRARLSGSVGQGR